MKSLLKALSDVILPALPASERVARDQANLVIGHLTIIAEQWQHALEFELENLAQACVLAGELAGMNFDSALGDDLKAALSAAETVDRSDYQVVTEIHRVLKGVIDRLIAADHRRAPRERVWHRAAGLDPDAASLPSIASLFRPAVG